MNDQPTPRTDDQSVRYYNDATGTRIEYVAARFARQIERELTQRERERNSLEDQRDFAQNLIRILERERDEARNEILGWKNKWDCAIEMGAKAECERDEMTLRRNLAISLLDEERALADRLARIVEYGIADMDEDEPEFLLDAKTALEAWKEARK